MGRPLRSRTCQSPRSRLQTRWNPFRSFDDDGFVRPLCCSKTFILSFGSRLLFCFGCVAVCVCVCVCVCLCLYVSVSVSVALHSRFLDLSVHPCGFTPALISSASSSRCRSLLLLLLLLSF